MSIDRWGERSDGLNVAEGVETEEQRVFLAERMCPQLQVFLLSPPLSPENFGALLRKGGTPRKRRANERS